LKHTEARLAHYKYDCGLGTPFIEENISSTYIEAEISSEPEMWKEVMLEEMNSF